MNYKKFLLPIVFAGCVPSHAQMVTTIAGNGVYYSLGDGGPALSASFSDIAGMDVDTAGNVYVIDANNYHIRKIGTDGNVIKFAGTTYGYSGDGGSAASAQITNAGGIATDRQGNVYISDLGNNVIRKIDATGTITTYAGDETIGTGGDGGPATGASFIFLGALATDDSGNLFLVDNSRIRKISTDGTITTVAGTLTVGFSGDGGPATSASFGQLQAITVDHRGNIYAVDSFYSIRKINSDGTINTFAGRRDTVGFSGDGGPAAAAALNDVMTIKVNAYNTLLIGENDSRIRQVDTNGIITTFMGNGICNYAADSSMMDTDGVCLPAPITVGSNNNIYYAEDDHRIREINFSTALNTSGVNNINKAAMISVYPNPVSEQLNISGLENSGQVYVYDMTGRMISNAAIAGHATTSQMDVSSLVTGIYILQIADETGTIISRMKIQKL